jgi:hypothetical protein
VNVAHRLFTIEHIPKPARSLHLMQRIKVLHFQ